jgi:hypothetical protein
METTMKAWIESSLYHPSLMLPMAALTQLMVAHDFNLGQVGLIVAAKGVQAAIEHSHLRSLICTGTC